MHIHIDKDGKGSFGNFDITHFELILSKINNPLIITDTETLVLVMNCFKNCNKDELLNVLLAGLLTGKDSSDVLKHLLRFDFVNKKYYFHGYEIDIELVENERLNKERLRDYKMGYTGEIRIESKDDSDQFHVYGFWIHK